MARDQAADHALGGRSLRVGAIVPSAVAAIVPVLAQIVVDDNGDPAIPPVWARVALVAAPTLVALDRFLSFTNGGMRFVAAELDITRLRHEFECDWQERLVALPNRIPSEHVVALLHRARDLVLAVDDAVATETGAWGHRVPRPA